MINIKTVLLAADGTVVGEPESTCADSWIWCEWLDYNTLRKRTFKRSRSVRNADDNSVTLEYIETGEPEIKVTCAHCGRFEHDPVHEVD